MPIYEDLSASRLIDLPFLQRHASTPLVLASAFGFFGLIGGTLWGFSIQGSFLGTNTYAFALGMFCAGIAWVLGAAPGVYLVRDASPPTAVVAWALRVAAILFVVAAMLMARRFAAPVYFLPNDPELLSDARWVARSLHELEPELEPLRRLMLLDGVIAAADKVYAMTNAQTKIVPGHGQVTDRNRLKAWRDAVVAVRTRVQAEVRARKTIEQVLALKLTAPYEKEWPGGHERFVRAVYEELSRK